MTDARHVLLSGGSGADALRLETDLRAAGRDCEVLRAQDLDEARRLKLPPLALVVVSLTDTTSAVAWREWLISARQHPPLLALADLREETLVKRWLADGGDDWLFRPDFTGLASVVTRVERERREATQLEQRWRDGTEELLRLARSPRFFRGDDLAACMAELNEVAVRGIQASRCGVWLYDETGQWLELIDLYDVRSRTHTSGKRLRLDGSREYFEALGATRMLVVPDVTVDERSQQLLASYFQPENVGATIDVGVRFRGALKGALCLEYVGGPHRWHPGEESFAGALADLVSLALESAERFKLETALAESERRFRELFLHSNDTIMLYRVTDESVVTLEDMNPAAELNSGYARSAMVGKTASDVLSEPSRSRLESRWRQAIAARAPILYEHELQLPTGIRWFNTSMVPFLNDAGRVYRIASIARDVTALREAEQLQRSLEAQLADSQKNEALARLASHIAHDVNNLLTVVNAHAQRLLDNADPLDVAQSILQATARGRELTQQVLTFGRRRPPERKPLELAPLLSETVSLLRPTAGGVTLRERIGPNVPRVLGDSGQLHQVLTNLATNALQAMGDTQGLLTLSLEVVEVDYAWAARHPPLQAGRWVRLTVSDDGHGMDEATQKRIFEPFFSARRNGVGTGLGLAVVQSIVQAHDGAVVVESQPDRGTSFHVFLPALEEAAQRARPSQHLMLVDDHPGMARVSARLLETLGYRTTVFDDPREALEVFREAPRNFDAVLTDLSMPQMSGEDFTQALHEVRHDVPVIVSSGMAGELDDETRRRLRISAVLVKPWRLEEAVAALQRALR